jgi:ABC-2 type transport system ATP-binding protein
VRIREIMGLFPENPGLYPELSAYKNLDFYARLYGVPEGRRRCVTVADNFVYINK